MFAAGHFFVCIFEALNALSKSRARFPGLKDPSQEAFYTDESPHTCSHGFYVGDATRNHKPW